MRVFQFVSLMFLICLIPQGIGAPVQAPPQGLELEAKVDHILKLQEQILAQLEEMKQELYVIKIRATLHKRVTHA